MVVVASMLRAQTAVSLLRARGLRVLDYYGFQRFSQAPLRPVSFWPQFEEAYRRNRPAFDRIRGRIVEPRSLEVFDRIIDFRLTGDLSVMQGFPFDPVNQYFEDFLDLSVAGETFIDVGSYDGATSLQFVSRCPDFAGIVALEPDPANYTAVVANLAHLGTERVVVLNQGLGSARGVVAFEAGGGSTSRLHPDGGAQVEVLPLDALALSGATFVKMDIEGVEEEALLGGLATIGKHAPRLAISVYHRPEDLWRIPAVVDQAGVEYEIRLRHYTEGMDETVMFFLPFGRGA